MVRKQSKYRLKSSPTDCADHSLMDLSGYYTIWFKLGQPPKIVRDAIYYFHRIHTTYATPNINYQNNTFYCYACGADTVVNEIEMVAFLTDPGTIVIVAPNGTVYSKDVDVGMQVLSAPLVPGAAPQFKIVRGGNTVLSLVSEWEVSDNITVQDFSLKSRNIVSTTTVTGTTGSEATTTSTDTTGSTDGVTSTTFSSTGTTEDDISASVSMCAQAYGALALVALFIMI
jgi:hypothetical protein